LVREVTTAPEVISEKDLVIYKTIEIINSGKVEFPKNLYLIGVGDIKGDGIVQPLGAGKKMTTVLVIRSPGKAGKYNMTWRAAVKDSDGIKYIGEPFQVSFEVHPSKPKNPSDSPKKPEV